MTCAFRTPVRRPSGNPVVRWAAPLWLAASLGTGGCAQSTPAPQAAPTGEGRIIQEAQALDIIHDTLTDAGVRPGGTWEVDVGGDAPLRVDVRLGQGSFGIEWVSPQDRADWGEGLPSPAPGGQLRILPGRLDDVPVQILVLDHETYRYEADMEQVRHGAAGPREAESRLRRDVRDYLEYVRGQGGP
jgi:hypothetical protein